MKSFCWANAFLHAKQNSKNRTLNSLKTEMLRQDTLCLFIPDLNTTNAKQRAHKYISLLHYNTHVYIYSTCLTCLGLHPENGIHFMTTKFTQHHWLIILLSLPTNFLTVNPDFCLSQPFSLSTLASQLRIRAGTAGKRPCLVRYKSWHVSPVHYIRTLTGALKPRCGSISTKNSTLIT